MMTRPHIIRSKKLRRLANGKACVMCEIQDGTIVLAHSNLLEHGHCMSQKSSDLMGAWLCGKCHFELDQGKNMSKEEKRDFILTAICRTIMQMSKEEIIQIGN
tara:strand:+ start:725 stop:1033 length:309 start_codon:yes stop_codon:yes gene_type:complete